MKSILVLVSILSMSQLSAAENMEMKHPSGSADATQSTPADSPSKNPWGASGTPDAPNGGPALRRSTDGKYVKNPHHKMWRTHRHMMDKADHNSESTHAEHMNDKDMTDGAGK